MGETKSVWEFGKKEEEEEEEEEDLCLSLSLGGIYSKKALVRSNSVAQKKRESEVSESVCRSTSLPAWAAASAANSAALGRAIGRIKTHNNSHNFQGKEVQSSDNEKRQKKMKATSWAEVTKRMPSVTTTGDGPNGRRVQGFLYKYTKGHVSIVCVCHGTFLSPAEFVRHAGGTDVDNPMRHINVFTALPFSS